MNVCTLINTHTHTHIHIYLHSEQSPSETTMLVQSSLFKDTVLQNHQSIYVKLQLVKTEWGASGREKESNGLTE
jgi:hypothetical protein